MGTWSIPWEDMEAAHRFEARMAEPWMAEITMNTVPDYGPKQPGDDLRFEDGELRPYRRQGLLRRWARVAPIGTKEEPDWDVPELYHLFGDDGLFDDLGKHADETAAPFDARPFIRDNLRRIFEEFEGLEMDELTSEEQLPTFNVVRAAVGLPQL